MAKIYNFKGNDVRVKTDNPDQPWFIANDVCKILGLSNTTMAVRALDDDEKSTLNRIEVGMRQEAPINVVNEYGVYRLILRSVKKEAKVFQRWVTHEVLPQIRKTKERLPCQKMNAQVPCNDSPNKTTKEP